MNERERWIVYPLLFLALGAALRDKLVDRTTAKSIVCQELSIVDEEPTGREPQRTLVRIGRTKARPGGKSSALMQMNGDLEIFDDDLTDSSTPPFLFRAGRTDPQPSVPSTGFAIVRGRVEVDGLLAANQLLWQGMPLLPIQIAPGLFVPGIVQPASQMMPMGSGPKATQLQPSPRQPAGSSKKDAKSKPPSSPADDGK
jgi:hypothetical protein